MLLRSLFRDLLISMMLITVIKVTESSGQVLNSTEEDNQIALSASAETDLRSILEMIRSGISVKGWQRRFGLDGTGINVSPIYLFMTGNTNCFGDPALLENSINHVPNISRQDVIHILQNAHDSARNLFDCYVTQNSARGNLGENLKSAIFEPRFLVLALQNQSHLLPENFVFRYYKEVLDCMFGSGELSMPERGRSNFSRSVYPRDDANLDKTLFRYIDTAQLDNVLRYCVNLFEPVSTKILLDDDADSDNENFDNPIGGYDDFGNGSIFLFPCDNTQPTSVPKLDLSSIINQNSRENPYPNGCSTPYEVPRMPSAITFP